MHLTTAQHIHMIGIKGVGMTSVACCLTDLGKTLTGSDSSSHQITDSILQDRHIQVSDFNPDNISNSIDLVIYSGAYKIQSHPELIKATNLNLPIITQAEALAELTANKHLIAVCGVGGKTTTTSLLIHLLEEAGLNPSWSVGVSRVSSHLPPGKIGTGKLMIVEADEYAIAPPDNNNPKFSLYSPQIIICTNLAYDHPDVYPDFNATKHAFSSFFTKLKPQDLLIYNQADSELASFVPSLQLACKTQSFGTRDADHQIDYQPQTRTLLLDQTPFNLSIFGLHNARNAAAAALVALHLGVSPTHIAAALQSFSGIPRRLQLIRDQDNILYLDDYAHHPSELKAVLSALKSTYPTRRLIAVFQPHTYSRTKALLPQFAQSFSSADILLLAPLFASARETADPTISSATLASAITISPPDVHSFTSFTDIKDYLLQIRRPNDMIITLGAGDIYNLHELLKAT